jgi:CRISPR/Cas system endoribonuclease Cas6 (RAMP superfamily)
MCHLLDRDHHARVKDWAVSPVADGEAIAMIEVHTLSAAARHALMERAKVGTKVALGGQEALIVEPPRTVEMASWAELAASRDASSWRVDFETPTAFRSAERFSPLPTPSALLRGASVRWEALAPSGVKLPRLGHPEIAKVWVSDVAGETWIATIPHALGEGTRARELPGFVGTVTLNCSDRHVAATVDSLLRFAAFSGAGAYTAHGMGVITVEQLTRPDRTRGTAAQARVLAGRQ